MRRRSDELAAAIVEQVGQHLVSAVVVIAVDPVVVSARCSGDRRACAHAISSAIGALLWSEGPLDHDVGLRVHVDGLTADVDGQWMAGAARDRGSWRRAVTLSLS